MGDQFVGEIRIVGFDYPPSGWAQCDGQMMPIMQNTALFSLLGANYGGDGRSTFALPDLRGAAVNGVGQGPGLDNYSLGQTIGVQAVTLLDSEMPAHGHVLLGTAGEATSASPDATSVLASSVGGSTYKGSPFDQPANMADAVLAVRGGGQPHNNMMPYLAMNYIIALQGIFPQRP